MRPEDAYDSLEFTQPQRQHRQSICYTTRPAHRP
ncbi:MAG: hypothetical protein ACI8XZ_001314, partial [Gammaproteobacteria bacterium]